MKTLVYKIVIFLNIAAAILISVSYVSVFISPEFIPFMAFFGLLYPVLFFINFSFLIFWSFRKNKLLLISLFALILGFYNFLNFFGFSKGTKSETRNEIKILSYNVRMFNLYEWIKDKNAAQNILNYIKNENPDIICLQEFYSDNKSHNFQDSIIKFHNTKGYVISYKKGEKYSGNAIFSKYPIVNKGFVNIGTTKQKCIYADIKIYDDTVRFYSIHLASIHLDKKDYENIENIEETQTSDIFFGIGSKISKAYKLRSKEVEAVAPHIAECKYKTVVCGDFNDIPVSYSYNKIKGNLKDAFLEAGFGTGGTYNGILPSLRIDYILHSPEIFSSEFVVGKLKASDHFPVSCKISL